MTPGNETIQGSAQAQHAFAEGSIRRTGLRLCAASDESELGAPPSLMGRSLPSCRKRGSLNRRRWRVISRRAAAGGEGWVAPRPPMARGRLPRGRRWRVVAAQLPKRGSSPLRRLGDAGIFPLLFLWNGRANISTLARHVRDFVSA